ncbi:hypothetical protein MSG28_007255 [Choristoneura fumiferana]|uniref:Uncharacterized protein n=1 Tax=Choristoneura fumiferana TaxID=7141 RepID=A0ACC0JWK7_CHOFU|nr:hypothetical protein MSG28_007255 [Choristoneura fumiferana]
MTGHGSFGHYLHKIGREPNPGCHECGDPDDTAQQTLEVCSRWAVERQTLISVVRLANLSLPSIVKAMLHSERSWNAVASFCNTIMLQKEAAERDREEAADAHPLRRKRRGRRQAYRTGATGERHG